MLCIVPKYVRKFHNLNHRMQCPQIFLGSPVGKSTYSDLWVFLLCMILMLFLVRFKQSHERLGSHAPISRPNFLYNQLGAVDIRVSSYGKRPLATKSAAVTASLNWVTSLSPSSVAGSASYLWYYHDRLGTLPGWQCLVRTNLFPYSRIRSAVPTNFPIWWWRQRWSFWQPRFDI